MTLCYRFQNNAEAFMEPILFIGVVILFFGVAMTVYDLVRDLGCKIRIRKIEINNRCNISDYSGFRSRDISSSTACRAGLLQ